jgi:hypothetical protein
VAGDGVRSEGQDGRPGAGHRGRWRGAEQVDADVEPLHRARFDPVCDGAAAQTGSPQLFPGDDVVLAGGDPGDRSFDDLHFLSFERAQTNRGSPRVWGMRGMPRSLTIAPIGTFCRWFPAH